MWQICAPNPKRTNDLAALMVTYLDKAYSKSHPRVCEQSTPTLSLYGRRNLMPGWTLPAGDNGSDVFI